MKIAESDILMSSSRTYLEMDEEKQDLKMWIDKQVPRNSKDMVHLSEKARSLYEKSGACCEEIELDAQAAQEVSLKKLIAEILSGRKINIVRMEKAEKGSNPDDGGPSRAQEERQGWGLEYHYEQTHYEKEEVAFEASGVIRTADGKEIDFSLRLNMSREFLEKNSLDIRAGDAAVDPLVINFNGNAASLTDMKFRFDLDSDGVEDELSMLAPGSGFLAIDLNNDGIISNGSELFGPETGQGFKELAEYDTDKNRWIDENDNVYHRLRVMTVDPTGNQQLRTLKDTGVGAIYLNNTTTQFDVRNLGNNELLGQVQSSGIYLRENSSVGTIQQLNLVI